MESASLSDIRAISYFDSLTDEEAAAFARQCSAREYGARETVFVEGEESLGFYFLRSGRAKILQIGHDGREQAFRLVLPPDTFGEVPIFDGQPSPATVETLEPSVLVLVPREPFLRVVRSHPDVALALLGHFARRTRAFTQLVGQIGLQTVPARLSRYLFQLAREEGVSTPEGLVVRREITIQDLASLLGSVREVVTRALNFLESEGAIEVRRREIVIRDIDALERMV